jgi:hypothetical protein
MDGDEHGPQWNGLTPLWIVDASHSGNVALLLEQTTHLA